ncbi:MAG: hypothetical protein RLZZ324_1195 [Candidatus Parcubacteria bacterium]|jgi:HSP20 family protein
MSLSISLRRGAPEAEELLFPEAGPLLENAFAERRLAIDAFESATEVVVRAATPGARPEDIEVFVQNDMLTIRGKRFPADEPGARALAQECEWGSFSRSIILPAEIDENGIDAALKDGILTLRLPKTERARRVGVREILS